MSFLSKFFTGSKIFKLTNSSQVSAEIASAIAAIANELVPTGCVQHFGMTVAPTGWLPCNGAAVSRATYADLFATIGVTFGAGDGSTTFNVPQMGGIFVRSWETGQAVDSGRVFGSQQAASTENLYARVIAAGAQDLVTDQTAVPSWSSDIKGTSASIWVVDATSRTTGTVVAPIGTGETKPINIALLACIKT